MEEPKAINYYSSPLGWIKITAGEKGICSLSFFEATPPYQRTKSPLVEECIEQLDDYFNKKRKTFSLPFDLIGTDFQKKVWAALLKIPFGKTISYKQLAIHLGNEKVIRAAGTANGKNPLPIIIPCHRVMGATGELVGYSGGVDKKRGHIQFMGSSCIRRIIFQV
jgi:methylated-DNA-[protein]-cysteine S-methyltransferase